MPQTLHTHENPMSAIQIQPVPVPEAENQAVPVARSLNGALCALLVGACCWASWPLSNLGFLDDWSYAKTAQVFAQTGHFVYNGWATAMLGWQIIWGALFIKLFGFSFLVLRFSMLPIAMAAVFLFHQILLRFGVKPRNAVIGTLTLGLSPLFMPLAVSFMTDIPGLLVILVCIYCCQRALATSSAGTTILWLTLAAVSNVAGGSVRQIAWLGALVMLPSTGWLLRRRRGVLPACVVLWLGSAAGIYATMQWFAHQPYVIPEYILAPLLYSKLKGVLQMPGDLSSAFFCSLLITFPILVAWAGKFRQLASGTKRKYLLLAVGIGVTQFIGHRSLPWLTHLLLQEFARHRNAAFDVPGFDLFTLPLWARALTGSLVIATGLLMLLDVRDSLRPAWKASLRRLLERDEVILLGPFTAAYLLLLCPRASIGGLFDRYLLGLLPVFIVGLLLFFQARRGAALPRSSVVVVAVFGFLSVAATHNWFSWQRALGAAADEVIASGVPRTQIEAGVEYDGWTEVVNSYVHSRHFAVYGHETAKASPDTTIPEDCQSDFSPFSVVIHPKYAIGFDRESCFVPTNYPRVAYTRWLPPFHDTVTVQRIVGR